jgi:hypothetical protein
VVAGRRSVPEKPSEGILRVAMGLKTAGEGMDYSGYADL